MFAKLSKADVERLITDRSAEARRDTVTKIANKFETGQFTPEERRLAEEIFRAMLRDTTIIVRKTLAENLRNCPDVPHDVALALARDVDEVALPMLESSIVLSDADLVDIVQNQGTAKQIAIARRPTISSGVADALVDSHNEDVVAELVANSGAELGESTLSRVLDEFADNERIKTPLAYRRQIPVAIAERLVTMVSEQLREHVLAHHELSPGLASDLILQARERATMQLSGNDTVEELVRSLADNGRLTPSIVLRALCTGDMAFFEWSVAVLAGVPIKSARALIHDQGALGLRAAYDKAALPEDMYAVVRTAVDVARETEYDGAEYDRERFTRRMLERVITHFEDPDAHFDPDNLEYLLGKITMAAKGAPRLVAGS